MPPPGDGQQANATGRMFGYGANSLSEEDAPRWPEHQSPEAPFVIRLPLDHADGRYINVDPNSTEFGWPRPPSREPPARRDEYYLALARYIDRAPPEQREQMIDQVFSVRGLSADEFRRVVMARPLGRPVWIDNPHARPPFDLRNEGGPNPGLVPIPLRQRPDGQVLIRPP